MCSSREWRKFIFLAVLKVPALFSSLLHITGGYYRSPFAVSMSNMKQYKCQQCNIACSSQLFDQSNLNWTCCRLNSDDFCTARLEETRRKKEKKTKRENKMKNALGKDVMSILLLFFTDSLSILCACALIVRALKVWIFGFDTPWLIFWSGYQGNALWQSCNTRLLDQKAFCFLFISCTLSQEFIERARK